MATYTIAVNDAGYAVALVRLAHLLESEDTDAALYALEPISMVLDWLLAHEPREVAQFGVGVPQFLDALKRTLNAYENVVNATPVPFAGPPPNADLPIEKRTTREGDSYELWRAKWQHTLGTLGVKSKLSNALIRLAQPLPKEMPGWAGADKERIIEWLRAREETFRLQKAMFCDASGYLLPFDAWVDHIIRIGPPVAIGYRHPLVNMRNVAQKSAQQIYDAIADYRTRKETVTSSDQ